MLQTYVLNQAIDVYHYLPDKTTRLTPIDTFTSLLHFGNNDLQRLHVFGCPVYALKAKL